MTTYDTFGRVLLGTAFGFVMGIVIYQAAGIDGGIINNIIKADLIDCSLVPDKPILCGGDTCCWADGCVGGTCHNPNADCSAYTDPPCQNCTNDGIPDACRECTCQAGLHSYPPEACTSACHYGGCCDTGETPPICRY